MATLEGWLNTSKDKSSVWVKPTDNKGAITDSVFVNLESKDATEILVAILREAFAKKVVYTFSVSVDDIQRAKSGNLFIRTTLDTVLDRMVETTREPSAPIAAATIAKAQSILANLAKRETIAEVTPSDDLLSF